MQIHELSRRRRSDEGFMDVVKGVGGAAATALGQATGLTTPNAQAASAGILDPAKKLDAVRKNSDMQRVAAQLAAGWTAEANKSVSSTGGKTTQTPTGRVHTANPANPNQPAATTPLPEAVGTYNKKTGAANLDGKTMTSLSDLPPAIQQQIQAKQQAAAAPAATTTPAPAATTPPKSGTLPKPGTPPGFNATNIMQMPGMQPAGKKPAPAATTPTTTPPKPGAPSGFNAANVMKMPGMPGQPVTPGAAAPAAAGQSNTMANAPVSKTNTAKSGNPNATPAAVTPPADPAEKEYWNKFLAYVNKKTAIRDASTYQMIGLDQIQKQSGYKNELEAAKAKILQAYKAGQDVTPAATEYILTAMAGAQLISSKNRAGVELEQPEVDPNNPDAAAGATGDDGAAADGAAPGTAPTAGGKILDIAGVQAVFKDNGVDPALLPKLGTELQKISGTNAVTKTGNGTVDNMLRALGFKVT